MKNIIKNIGLFLMVFCVSMQISAQENRTLSTKVADILAQLPTKDLEHSDLLSQSIIDLKSEGILEFINMLVPLGTGDDTQARYAIHSAAIYSGAENEKIVSNVVEDALLMGIEKASNVEVKTFLIDQLIYCGTNKSIPLLKGYLSNQMLYKPALVVLTSIGSTQAKQVILEAAKISEGNMQPALIHALGVLKVDNSIGLLQEFSFSKNVDIQQKSLMAHANIGLAESFDTLYNSVKNANFKMDDSRAIIAFIHYGIRLKENNNEKLSIKVAELLLKNCSSDEQLHYRIAAIDLLSNIHGAAFTKTLIKESKNNNFKYRGAIIKAASKNLNATSLKLWVKAYKKSSSNSKTQIILLLQKKNESIVVQNVILPAISDTDVNVRIAGIKALVYQDRENSKPVLITALKKATSKNEFKSIEATLLGICNSNDNEYLSAALNGMNDEGKIVLIHVLSARIASSEFDQVIAELKSENELVRSAVFKALPNITIEENLTELLQLLSNTNEKRANLYIQDAIIQLLDKSEKEHTAQIINVYNTAKNKSNIIPILPALKTKEALGIVVKTFEIGNNKEQSASLLALSKWRNKDAIPYLFLIVDSNKDAKLRAKAFGFYLDQVKKSSGSNSEKLSLIKKLMPLAKSDKEKGLVLRSVTRIKTIDALVFVSKYLENEGLVNIASNTAIRIALPTAGKNDELSGELVRDIVSKSIDNLSGHDSQYLKIDVKEFLGKMPKEASSKNAVINAEELKDGFVSLFNGEDLDHWIGNKTDYLVENYEIAVRPKQGGHGNLYSEKEYSDFVFRFEFKLTPGANNGLGIHAPLKGDVAYVGKELQILDNTAAIYANLKPYQYHGSLYGVIKAKRGFLNPIGTWNTEEVIVIGNRIKITLNGTVILEGDYEEVSKNGTLDGQSHPGLKRKKGHIGFLGHGSELQFRNIRIKDLNK